MPLIRVIKNVQTSRRAKQVLGYEFRTLKEDCRVVADLMRRVKSRELVELPV